MQPNLDSYSLDGRAIVLPAPRPDRAVKRALPTTITPLSELEQSRKSVARTSAGEQIAWLAVTLSAISALGLSFWF